MKIIKQYYSKYLNDKYSIIKYTDDAYKFIYHKYPVRNSGFEDDDPNYIQDRNINDHKLDNNISRARSKIFEYARCNEFDYFVTLTLDKNKYDRYDLAKYIKDLGQHIRDDRKRTGSNIQYLLIPEPHFDNAWHMHGLIKGMPLEHLTPFTLNDYLPYKVRELIEAGREIYNWTSYSEKFGWCTIEKVKSQEAISKYVTKYISKAIQPNLKREKEKKLYYVTRGLKTAEKVKEGYLTSAQLTEITFNYENDYVAILDLNGLQYLKILHQLGIL